MNTITLICAVSYLRLGGIVLTLFGKCSNLSLRGQDMKETFSVKEIMEGTGLTRQRIHALIRSRKIPVVRENKHFLVKWQDLLRIADNPTILGFLESTLESEKKKVDNGYRGLRENAKAMMYAYVLLLEKELPTPEGEDLEWIRLFRKAYTFWWKMPDWYGCHWSLEADKYDYLDEEKTD